MKRLEAAEERIKPKTPATSSDVSKTSRRDTRRAKRTSY
jgi:hypothetical protein